MARRKSQAQSVPESRKHRKLTHEEKLALVSRYKRVSDPTNKRSVHEQYKKLRAFPLYLQREASAEQRAELKKRGFFTTDKGVIVDGPRTGKRKPIEGTKFRILKGGVVRFEKGARQDYIIGLTKAEKKAFALDPKSFVESKEKELKALLKTRGIKFRDFQTRIQWGAYQGTKDFTPRSFQGSDTGKRATRALAKGSKRQIDRDAADKMTGLHIVIHRKGKK